MRKKTEKGFLNKTSVIVILSVLAVIAASLAVGTTLAKYVIDVTDIAPFTLKVYHRYDIYYGSIGTAPKSNPNPKGYSQLTGELLLQPAECAEGYTFAGWLLSSTIDMDSLNTAVIARGSSAIESEFVEKLVIDGEDASVTAHTRGGSQIPLTPDANGRICLYALYKVSWEIGNRNTTYKYGIGYLKDSQGRYYKTDGRGGYLKDTFVDGGANLDATYGENTSALKAYLSANGGHQTYNVPIFNDPSRIWDSNTDPAEATASLYIGSGNDRLLVIEGSGDVDADTFGFMQRLSNMTADFAPPWSGYKGSITRVVIPDNASLRPTFLAGWFDGMSSAYFIYLGDMDTSNMSNADYTFRNCTSLSNLVGFGNVEGTHVFQSRGTFMNCSSLTTIDMGGFVNPNGNSWSQGNTNYTMVHLNDMFSGCTNLTTIKHLEELDTTQFYHIGGLFRNCSKLTGSILLNSYGVRIGHEPDLFDANERARSYEGFMENASGIELHYTSTVRISLILALIHTSSNPQVVYCHEDCGFARCYANNYNDMHLMLNGNYVTSLNDSNFCTEATLNSLITAATNNNPYVDQGYTLYAFQIRQAYQHDIAYSRIATSDPSDINSLEKIMATFQNPTTAGSPICVQPIYRKNGT